MAILSDTNINDSGFIELPKGTTAQRPSSPTNGMIRFNTTYNKIEYYTEGRWVDPDSGFPLGAGLTQETAAKSAVEILHSNPFASDGVYWIDLPIAGPTQTYCVMNKDWDGGGWMLAMKCTRGNTFSYAANYWTTANTLNPTALNLNDGDAKFNVFNYFEAKDIMSRHPDVGSGGSVANNIGGWTCNEPDFYRGRRVTMLEFFRDGPTDYYLRQDGDVVAWPGHGNNGPWSAQGGWRRYGFNIASGGRQARWGFSWNNETTPGSNDVDTAIWGMGSRQNYSCGDYITCCQTYTGANRSMRAEMWIR